MIDAWSGPTPTPQQFPHHEQNGIRKLLDKIAALELRIKESTSNLLRTAGIRLTKLGMFIDSSLTVGGSLDVTGPMVVGGTLSLPAGIIDNAALASPVIPESVYDIATNFGLTISYVTKTSVTVEVPAGFTKAVVAMVGRVFAYNPNTTGGGGDGADYLYGRVTIAGVAGVGLPSVVPGWSSSGLNVAPMSRVLSGLTPGSTFDILLSARTSYAAWAAHADHNAELSGNIMWFR